MLTPADGPKKTPPTQSADERLTSIQNALGVVTRRAKDGAFHEKLGERVGFQLEGQFYSTLARLHMADGCTVTELATALGLETSSCSRRINILEDAGLVRREAGTFDRRIAHLWLTEEGRELFETLQEGWRQMLAEVTAGWDDSEIETFAALFRRFADDFESYAAAGVASLATKAVRSPGRRSRAANLKRK
jgi:DNA-binding MarR family transcriptional regulator